MLIKRWIIVIEYLIVHIATSRQRFADLVIVAIVIVQRDVLKPGVSNRFVLSGSAIKILFVANCCMRLDKRGIDKRRK